MEKLSQSQSLSEVSVPESGMEHSDTQTVDVLVKEVVIKTSELLRALNEGQKTELILLSDHLSEAAFKLGNKISFDLTSLGIAGVKRFFEMST